MAFNLNLALDNALQELVNSACPSGPYSKGEKGGPMHKLREAYHRLSSTYRQLDGPVLEKTRQKNKFDTTRPNRRGGGASTSVHSPTSWDTMAYALARMPATCQAQIRVWQAFAACLEGQMAAAFAPQTAQKDSIKDRSLSFMDIGAGPGTSLWALAMVPEVMRLFDAFILLEREPAFIELGQRLTQKWSLHLTEDRAPQNRALIEKPPLLQFIRSTFGKEGSPSAIPAYADVVLASYCLQEVPDTPRDITNFLSTVWKATRGVCVIIEPGTPRGFSRILAARTYFTNHGGTTLAPCCTNGPCPMTLKQKAEEQSQSGHGERAPGWCHFRTTVPRGRPHRFLKDGRLNHESEPYSYLIVAKNLGVITKNSGRIVSRVKKNKIGLSTRVCQRQEATSSSALHLVDKVCLKGTQEYKTLKGLDWGDALGN